MRTAKSIGPAQIEQTSEPDNKTNIAELTRERDTSRQHNSQDNPKDELSADHLDTLLRPVSEASTREIENLMDELHGLRNKLQSDGSRIQSDIEKYTQLSQGVLQ